MMRSCIAAPTYLCSEPFISEHAASSACSSCEPIRGSRFVSSFILIVTPIRWDGVVAKYGGSWNRPQLIAARSVLKARFTVAMFRPLRCTALNRRISAGFSSTETASAPMIESAGPEATVWSCSTGSRRRGGVAIDRHKRSVKNYAFLKPCVKQDRSAKFAGRAESWTRAVRGRVQGSVRARHGFAGLIRPRRSRRSHHYGGMGIVSVGCGRVQVLAHSSCEPSPMLDVLIVDDDSGFVQTCALMLRHDGYAVAAAESVRAARTCLAYHVPHAMLLDWKLLDGDALDVLKWMRGRCISVPTALVTGFWADPSWESAERDARRLGVRIVVRRVIDADEPTAVVRRLIDPLSEQHAAVLRGDVDAIERLAADLSPRVARRLHLRFPSLSVDLIQAAALDATVWYFRHAAKFDPVRDVSVERFAYHVGRRMVWDGVRGERRRREREEHYAGLRQVMMAPESAEISAGRSVIAQAIERAPDRLVRMALRAWLDGDTSPDPWLAISAVARLPPPDRRADIARRKDAFTARVRRLAKHAPRRN